MNAIELIKSRRSTRQFTEEPIAEETLKVLIEAANWAPSAGNRYPWGVVIVEQKNMIDMIKAVSPGLVGDPTALILLCADREKALRVGGTGSRDLFCVMDIVHAAQNICLQATDLGIGTCCIMSFNPKAVAELLELEANMTADYIISLGYPKKPATTPQKRSIEEAIISWIKEE
jgi:nitroreductase